MPLSVQLAEDIKNAMKAKDPVALNVVRALKSAIKYAAIENCRYEINEAEKMMRREGIRWMSSTAKSIEEIAATILQEIKPETR